MFTNYKSNQIVVVILEDNPSDAELIQRELHKAGLDFTAQVVQGKAGFDRVMDVSAPDIILVDYSLPGFDGLIALALARERFPDVPVIIVSGTIGEELAVAALKAGATDYVLKQRLNRLGGVVIRALQEALQLAEKKRVEAALFESEQRLRALFDNAGVGLVELDQNDHLIAVNNRVCEILGYSREELLHMTVHNLTAPEDRKLSDELNAKLHEGVLDRFAYDKRYLSRDGLPFWVHITVSAVRDANGHWQRSIASIEDISERKKAEEALRHAKEELEDRVRERTAQLRTAFSELTQAEQRERKRLAVLLHDHLQQLLITAKIRINMLKTMNKEGDVNNCVAESINLIQEALNTSRSLTIELCPPILIDEKLPASLEWLGNWMKQQHCLDVVVRADENADPRDHNIRIFLFEAARELLFNVKKHAGIDHAEIRIHLIANTMIEMQVIDEGAGMDSTHLAKVYNLPDHFSLFSIKERLEFLGGTICVESKPREGTRITIRVPLVQ